MVMKKERKKKKKINSPKTDNNGLNYVDGDMFMDDMAKKRGSRVIVSERERKSRRSLFMAFERKIKTTTMKKARKYAADGYRWGSGGYLYIPQS
jgi:hypothetical protein